MSHVSSSSRRRRGARTAVSTVMAMAALGATFSPAQARPIGPCDGPCPTPPPAPVPCTSDQSYTYDCFFYPAGNGISAGAPVQAPDGHRVGYLSHGTNFVYCQAGGAEVSTGHYHNNNWAYTEANNRARGWVNAVWARGGTNDGPYGRVPACRENRGSPPQTVGPPQPPPARCGAAMVPDPTTSGRITRRMCILYYAMKATGMTHGARCWGSRPRNPSSDHPAGRACDFSYDFGSRVDVQLGWRMAGRLTANARRYGLHYLIWQDQEWSIRYPWWKPYRSRAYGCPAPPDRRHLTGCHYDHIHVSVL